MRRRFLAGLTIALMPILSGCTDSSQYPTVPPPPPAGSIPEAPPQSALPKDFMKGKTGRPAPSTPTAL